MAKKQKKLGSIRRFGSRYGRKLKQVFGKIEEEQRKLHKCPYCNKVAVKRVQAGIWHCRKCDAKFTGGAYTVGKKKAKAAKVEEEEDEQDAEESLEEEDE